MLISIIRGLLNYLTQTSISTNESMGSPMFRDPISLLLSQSLDAKLLKNKFQKQLTHVVSDLLIL
jgi:hypothetical protein